MSFSVNQLPWFVRKSPEILRKNALNIHVHNQVRWLKLAWNVPLPVLRTKNDLTLTYSDTTFFMERKDNQSLFTKLDTKLFTFVSERGGHPGCSKVGVPLEEISIHLLNLRLHWDDEEVRLQQNLNKLFVDSKSTTSKEDIPVHLIVDAHFHHGRNLEIFSHLNLSLASDHINPEPGNVIKNYVWRFSSEIGFLYDFQDTSHLPENLMETWLLRKAKFSSNSEKVWKVRSMMEV